MTAQLPVHLAGVRAERRPMLQVDTDLRQDFGDDARSRGKMQCK